MNELKYLETYGSENTIRTYKFSLKTFLGNVYGEGELKDLAEKYFQEDRDHKSDLQDFLAHIKTRPPKTVRLMLSAVRTFLGENNVELPQRFWKGLSRRVKGSMARTQDKVPSNVELRRIVMHMPVHGKALYLSLASSGMRIGEALQLTFDDIDLDHDPPKISIRGEYTKSGDKRIAFISGEAREHIEEWLKYRKEYLKSAVKRSWKYEKTTEDNRLFPFGESTANFIWNNSLSKAGLDQKDASTKRRKIHPHVLRKFFRTRMGSVIPVDVTEALMGHKGYLTDVYRRYGEEDLAKFYKQGETAIVVFGKVEESLKIKEDVRRLEAIIHDLQRSLDQKVETIARHVFPELLKEDREALKELQKWREEFTRRYYEDVKQRR